MGAVEELLLEVTASTSVSASVSSSGKSGIVIV
jgi:hypothetical protein